MNADPASQLRLLELQDVDSTVDRLTRRRANLPELAELAQLAERARAGSSSLVRAETETADLDREQRRLEADVEVVRNRMQRDQQRLDTGQVGSPRELENLQSELVSLRRRRDALEDQLLEVMERREEADGRAGQLRAQQESLGTEQAAVAARRDAAYVEIDHELADARARRQPLADGLPADLLALYEKVRAGHDGVGAAALYRGRCEGCRLSLTAADLGRIRSAPPDVVLRCEECNRILVRTQDSGL